MSRSWLDGFNGHRRRLTARVHVAQGFGPTMTPERLLTRSGVQANDH